MLNISKLFKKIDKNIYLINNKYILKKESKKRLIAENFFLFLYKSQFVEEVVFYKKNFRFAIYKYYENEKIKNKNVLIYLELLKKIIEMYKTYEEDGYGDILNKNNSWGDFLRNEIEINTVWMSDEIDKYSIVNNAINKLEKYKFNKKIIHGDMGIYNILFINEQKIILIDPRTIIGDSLYDILFFVISKSEFVKNIDLDTLMKLIDEPREKVLNMLLIIIYINIARRKKKNISYEVYEQFWKKILNI
ncbi:MAG: hypothetical protein J6I85_02145 [Clostridia bacterium]|nr:hypothetical protein [Clostridia bacterium]